METTINSVMKGRCEPRWLESFRVSKCSQFWLDYEPQAIRSGEKWLQMNKGEMAAVGTYSHPMEHFGVLLFFNLQARCDTTCFFSNICLNARWKIWSFSAQDLVSSYWNWQLKTCCWNYGPESCNYGFRCVAVEKPPPLGKTVVSGRFLTCRKR